MGKNMSEKKKYSMFVRMVCGLLGLLGIAATAFNTLTAEEITFEIKLLAIAFACFIFIYVAITGKNPLETTKKSSGEAQ